MSERVAGAWLVYYNDKSMVRVFSDELAALRRAVESHAEVIFVRDGESIDEAEAREAGVRSEAAS